MGVCHFKYWKSQLIANRKLQLKYKIHKFKGIFYCIYFHYYYYFPVSFCIRTDSTYSVANDLLVSSFQ